MAADGSFSEVERISGAPRAADRSLDGLSRRLVAVLAGLAGLSISILGCDLGESRTGECSPPPGGCQRSTFTTEMPRGEITFRLRSGESITSETLKDTGGNAAVDGCIIDGLAGEIMSDETVISLGPSIHCNVPGGYLYVGLHPLTDIRRWPLGRHPVPATDALAIELCDRPGRTGRGCTFCRPTLGGVLVTVVVEEAAGGPAPYPEMVTPDYRRRYRIEVETGALSADECDGMTISLSLDLQQTAAGYVNDPHGQCWPCE